MWAFYSKKASSFIISCCVFICFFLTVFLCYLPSFIRSINDIFVLLSVEQRLRQFMPHIYDGVLHNALPYQRLDIEQSFNTHFYCLWRISGDSNTLLMCSKVAVAISQCLVMIWRISTVFFLSHITYYRFTCNIEILTKE